MDVIAHGLWAGIGLAALSRRWPVTRGTAALTVAPAVLPDVAQLAPLVIGAVADGRDGIAVIGAYVSALPGHEPVLSPSMASWTHHLHCTMHSAVVASAVTLLLWLSMRALWIPLLGWWSHIVIDVFTHSSAYYPVPVFYPLPAWGFDGLAWNTPWFLAANYVAIVLAIAALWLRHRNSRPAAAR